MWIYFSKNQWNFDQTAYKCGLFILIKNAKYNFNIIKESYSDHLTRKLI